ncbi:DUF1223 domain-containing protein [Rhodobacter sp. HX-7-19]|uniref:DUF1223 domain-containing protein n=1 Tax=Paragemmobacter kunshanensis TaxID=2583234 RepID=A0A6M1U760_9RHOB|nr:DUF1223 domain-containing protein [Rhodobacter kunshanensis]NGQ90913.1 DUF1223 domain-containing protein [Rhodobacter kunshanensis]
MRHIVSGACGLLLCLAAPVAAQSTEGVVVELYTSQGCSSCPPADEFMAELATHEEVIALALHVDYWDYIGWEDSFAKAQFTERQKSYARAAKSRMIYTPQMIIGGVERVEGNEPESVVKLIGKHLAAVPTVRVTLERMGDQVRIGAVADRPLPGGAVVQMVRYLPAAEVAIERGENAGRVVTYRNIVTEWKTLADWPGQAPLEMMADAPGAEPVVVIVQEPGPASVLAAARLE